MVLIIKLNSPRSFKLIFLLMTIIIPAMVITGCDEGTTGPEVENAEDDEPGPDEVWMQSHAFTPLNLNVEPGTTVTWTNQEDHAHDVTSGSNREPDGLFSSGDIAPGGIFEYTFDEPGTYDYFCSPHDNMSATIIVNENNDNNNEEDEGNDNDDGYY